MHDLWQDRLRKAIAQRPNARTFAAFNLNVDVVARVTPAAIERLVAQSPDLDWDKVASVDVESLRSIKTREEFVALLRHGFETGKSALLVRDTEDLVPWWREIFTEREESMGGQAGIIANQMAALGARSVVYSPLLSPRQASFFEDGVVWPKAESGATTGSITYVPAREAGNPDDLTREPWVFEYRKGETFRFPDRSYTTPRANRAIVTTAIQGPERRFHGDISDHLSALGSDLDVAFMAGYHQCGSEPDNPEAVRRYMDVSCADLATLTSSNPQLKIHIEYVPAKVREVEKEFYKRLGGHIHSFGINEVETRGLLRRFDRDDLAKELEENERAFLLYQAGLLFLNELGVERVHIHNLGYYVVVLKKPYGKSVAAVRDACLYASAVNARKAQVGGFVPAEDLAQVADLPLSDIGYNQLKAFAHEMSEHLGPVTDFDTDSFVNEGVWEADDHIVLVTPSHIVPNPVGTVGMGDTISSSSYLFEVAYTDTDG